jgi:zinc/manganese transport system substrate-binding protein
MVPIGGGRVFLLRAPWPAPLGSLTTGLATGLKTGLTTGLAAGLKTALLPTALLLTGCGAVHKFGGSAPGQRLQVVTTILPITIFTRAVAGDCAEVMPLMPSNIGPHDFQATPDQLVRLRHADVLVKNGLGLEVFLDKLIANADNPRLRLIDSSQGIAPLASAGHDHDHDHDHGHPKAKAKVDAGPNPHIWLDPMRAIQQVNGIRDGLIAAQPSCSAKFTANAASYTAQLRRLDAELAQKLKPYAGKTFVTFHDFTPYFAARYQLKTNFLVDMPEENPTPADLRRVLQQVNASGLRALLSEPQLDSKSFEALASDLGVKIGSFDSLESGPTAAASQGDYYLQTMRRNGDALATAFGG